MTSQIKAMTMNLQTTNRVPPPAPAAGLLLLTLVGGLVSWGCKPAPPPEPAPVTATNTVTAPAAQPATQAVAAPAITPSGPPVRHVSMVGCKTRIDGTATGKTWTMDGGVISGYFEVNPADLFAGKPGRLTAAATAIIPVRSMKSGSSTMDERMQREMRMDEHPMIGFVLHDLTLQAGPAGGPIQAEARGALAMAGVTNHITLPVTFTRTGDGTLKATTAADLKMTSFKIPPPKFSILGQDLMETGDDVKVSLEWPMRERAP